MSPSPNLNAVVIYKMLWATRYGPRLHSCAGQLRQLSESDSPLNLKYLVGSGAKFDWCLMPNLSGISENQEYGPMSVKQTLVLDGEKGKLVMKASERMGKKIVVSESKTMAALKSHSEGERRRRERINAHLATLRGLLPISGKMDKATLLAQVISEVKQLKKTARRASEGLHIPMDTNQVQVEKLEDNADDGSVLLRASLCCDYTPDLLSNVKQAINDLPWQLLKCEISTLGGRVKIVFLITASEEKNCGSTAAEELHFSTIRATLSNILDKVSASVEYAQEICFLRKGVGFLMSILDDVVVSRLLTVTFCLTSWFEVMHTYGDS
ncbi:UNVERIFIED_CONTAM: Transcription factor [Sesamum calycinum]|uniref:Transcription factor n=1 Tax=Sesamum calycinum TaxID=2727403 RepID=A0AAW2Q6Q2_9LAMI